jgi:DNA-binding winged helix-turn-helix (wHTH) protein/tetratricopeptide (TPR) repeat protein
MKGTLPQRVRLGVFEVDLRAGELRQDEGAVLVLSDQPLQILRILIEADGEIVSRDEIRERLWPDDTIVEFDHSINNAIKKLRRALVDSGDEPHYIGTIAKRGYRLLVPVERVGTADDAGDSRGTADPSAPSAADSARDDTIGTRASGKRSTAWKWLATVAVACIAVVVAALYWRAHRAPKLTERDIIVVADFDNKTDDPVFDDTLRQALTIQMEQSPFLNVLSDEKVGDTLKLMSRQAGDRLSPEVAHEVCVRSNSQALLAGSIAAIGNQYLITLRATNCQNGDTLASAEAEADSRNQVLSSLSIVANKLREKLGESGSSVQKFNQPLEQVTTSSLEALQAYTQGRKLEDTRSPDTALPYYKRAVELDPNFAIGYAALSQVYAVLFDGAKQEQNLTKAYQLRDRVSLRERYNIEDKYYNNITGEVDKEIVALTEWTQSYPDDYQAHDRLAAIYLSLGQYDKAIPEALASNQNRPTLGGYCVLMKSYMAANRLNEAKSSFQEARRNNLDGIPLRQQRFLVAFLEGDEAGMKEQDAWAMAQPVAEAMQLTLHSSIEARRGRFVKAREVMRDAEVRAGRAGAAGIVDALKIVHGPAEADVGNNDVALQFVKEVWTNHKNIDYIEATVALTFALLGNQSEAQNLVDKMNRETPLDTVAQSYTLPTIRAVVELKSNNPAKAIDLLRVTEPYELADLPMPPNALYPAYVRGLAYLQLGQGRQAAAEFQKLIDHPGVALLHHQGALARLQLGRAQAMMGDKAAAEKSYRDFLTLWKDADPDIPIYQQAKAEYAKLQ